MNTSLPNSLPRGPVMVDVAGLALTDHERIRLLHPLVGGVILFARNFSDSAQLAALTAEIHALRSPALLVAVDHEGGRVQRFRTDRFTRLLAMRTLGVMWEHTPHAALKAAYATGYVLAADLLAHGVDLSFTPVLDLDYGVSQAIGNRAFHHDPQVVIRLATMLAQGMAAAGMACVGKHFPGHGFVEADSHHETPVDQRDFETLWAADILPYRRDSRLDADSRPLIEYLAGVMPAHVIYSRVDSQPAGFSSVWLRSILREKLGFQGIIFSDDLNMQGAMGAGDIVARATAAQLAGCDMVLVCNQPELADSLLARWQPVLDGVMVSRLAGLPVASTPSFPPEEYQHAMQIVQGLADTPVSTADTGSVLAAEVIGNTSSLS